MCVCVRAHKHVCERAHKHVCLCTHISVGGCSVFIYLLLLGWVELPTSLQVHTRWNSVVLDVFVANISTSKKSRNNFVQVVVCK